MYLNKKIATINKRQRYHCGGRTPAGIGGIGGICGIDGIKGIDGIGGIRGRDDAGGTPLPPSRFGVCGSNPAAGIMGIMGAIGTLGTLIGTCTLLPLGTARSPALGCAAGTGIVGIGDTEGTAMNPGV